MNTTGRRWARATAAAFVAIGGGLWVLALFVPLAQRGIGSTEPSYQLADYALAGTLQPFVQPWWGALWYVTALAGCAVLATCPFTDVRICVGRMVLATATTALAVAVSYELATGVGPSTRLSIAAWLCVALGSGTQLALRRTGSPAFTFDRERPRARGIRAT